MSQVVSSAMLLAALHFTAMLSPGPTAMVVLRRGAQHELGSIGPLVLGIAAATLTNTLLVSVGISSAITADPGWIRALALLGASYLIWLGVKNIVRAVRALSSVGHPGDRADENPGDFAGACKSRDLFQEGYLINLLNPSIGLFYISVFSQIAPSGAGHMVLALYGIQMVLQSLVFWSGFAYLVRKGVARKPSLLSSGWIDLVFGLVLILFSMLLVGRHMA